MERLTVLECTKCGKAKELGESLLTKTGDWICYGIYKVQY